MSDDIEEHIDDHRGVQGRDGVQGIAGPRGIPGASATPEAIARAAELKAALEENTTALHKLKRHQFITSGALLGLSVMTAAVGYLYWQVQDTQGDLKATQAQNCEAGNNVRQGLLNIADTLERAGSSPAFVAELREDFALRDCPR